MSRTTIKDVAQEAGVSIGTVSAVLNRRDSVRSVTRNRVLGVINTLNYRPVEAARRRLATPREKTLGLVVKEIHNPYFADIIIGAAEEARKHNYRLLVMSSEQVLSREVDAVNVLVAKDIDGLIINPLMDDGLAADHFADLTAHNIPFVMLEGLPHDEMGASVVDIDNEKGAFDATMHLIEWGHTHIVHLAGPSYSQHALERKAGVLSAAPNARIIQAGATLEDGYNAVNNAVLMAQDSAQDRSRTGAQQWMGADAPFTALVCYNDLVAIGAMRRLQDEGLRVPDQVSVVGFDDIDVASYLGVPLTTVRVPKREMGRKAASIAIERIHSTADLRRSYILLDAELIVRSSTKRR